MALKYSDTFGGTVGATCTGYTIIDSGTFTYQSGAFGQLLPGSANYKPVFALETSSGTQTDFDVYIDFELPSAVEQYPSLIFRGAASQPNYYPIGYSIEFNPTDTSYNLYVSTDGNSRTYLNYKSFTASANTWYTAHVQCIGTTFQSKVYAQGATEPTAWDTSATDSTVTAAGYFGIYQNVGATNTGLNVDNLRIADAGGFTIAMSKSVLASAFAMKRYPPPANQIVAPSATANVTSNGHTWAPALVEDYLTPAAVGTIQTAYSHAGYFVGYSDTSGLGTYDPNSVCSVANSLLTISMHTGIPSANAQSGGAPSTSRPLVSSISPNGFNGQNYGRSQIRMRANGVGVGYKFVGIWWPSDDNWNTGEIDWPEADMGQTPRPADAIPGSGTDANGNSSSSSGLAPVKMSFAPGPSYYAPFDFTQFHTYTTEWAPDHILFLVDGRVVCDIENTAWIPTVKMRFEMQAETFIGEGAVPSGSVGTVDIDWVATWTLVS